QDRHCSCTTSKVSQVQRSGRDRETSFAQQLGVSLGKSRGDLTRDFGIPPQFQDFRLAAPLGQIGSVRAYHIEPSFVKELTKPSRAGTLALRVWIAVGFNADDLFDHGLNSLCRGPRFVLRVKLPIRGGGDERGESNCAQAHGCDDEKPGPPTAPQLRSESVAIRSLSVELGLGVAGQPNRDMRACPV